MDFCLDIWSFNKKGEKVYPYKGVKGEKKGYYSVNFTNDTNNFQAISEELLIDAIIKGKFQSKGTIRMLPINHSPKDNRNAYSPIYFKGKRIKK